MIKVNAHELYEQKFQNLCETVEKQQALATFNTLLCQSIIFPRATIINTIVVM